MLKELCASVGQRGLLKLASSSSIRRQPSHYREEDRSKSCGVECVQPGQGLAGRTQAPHEKGASPDVGLEPTTLG